jgi:hypothetical protein
VILTKAHVYKLASKLPPRIEYMGYDGPVGCVSRTGVLYGTSAEECRRAQIAAMNEIGGGVVDFVPDFGLEEVPVKKTGKKIGKKTPTAKGKGKGRGKATHTDVVEAAAFPDVFDGFEIESPSLALVRGTSASVKVPGTATATTQAKRAKAEDRSKRMDLKKRLLELQALLESLTERADELINQRDELSQVSQLANLHVNTIDTKRKSSALSKGISQLRQKLGAKPDTQIGFDTLRYRCLLEVVHKQCLASVRQLMSHKWGFPFSTPVDSVALGLPTYLDIVKEPMDLGTIKKLIEDGGKYVVAEEVDNDVRLTFANAMLFNAESTDVHTMARGLLAEWEPKWSTIKQRIEEVEACVLVEREMAEAKSDAAQKRADVVSKEKEIEKVTEALDIVSIQLREVEEQAMLLMRPILREERLELASNLRSLPGGLRSGAEDIVANHTNSWTARVHLEDVDAHSEITLHLLMRYAKMINRNRLAVIAGWCGGSCSESLIEKFKQKNEDSDHSAIATTFLIGQPLDDATSSLGLGHIAIPDELDFDLAFDELLDGVALDVSGGPMDLDFV